MLKESLEKNIFIVSPFTFWHRDLYFAWMPEQFNSVLRNVVYVLFNLCIVQWCVLRKHEVMLKNKQTKNQQPTKLL